MSTGINKKKIARVIKGDATLTGEYYDGKGNYCVIGGLLHEAGLSMKSLKGCRTDGVSELPDEAKELLLKAYGIDEDMATALMGVNDDYAEIEERRVALLEELEENW